MALDRRKFIKIASLGALGLAAKPAVDLFADVRIPEDSPLLGKRWAMVIDLKKCHEEKNCTACLDACHKTHNVPDFGATKDEIKWVWKETFHGAFHEVGHEHLDEHILHGPALVTCNHCNNPPCVRACPTGATWRREQDGIVMMDWHRCIGCRYCIVACPYGARSFNWRDPRQAENLKNHINPEYPTRMRGVVEKCTFCEERLARGKMPACVDVCPTRALMFGDLEGQEPRDEQLREVLKTNFSICRRPALGTQPQIYYLV